MTTPFSSDPFGPTGSAFTLSPGSSFNLGDVGFSADIQDLPAALDTPGTSLDLAALGGGGEGIDWAMVFPDLFDKVINFGTDGGKATSVDPNYGVTKESDVDALIAEMSKRPSAAPEKSWLDDKDTKNILLKSGLGLLASGGAAMLAGNRAEKVADRQSQDADKARQFAAEQKALDREDSRRDSELRERIANAQIAASTQNSQNALAAALARITEDQRQFDKKRITSAGPAKGKFYSQPNANTGLLAAATRG